jgi:hypothetical protein
VPEGKVFSSHRAENKAAIDRRTPKRFATTQPVPNHAQRLDCVCFSTTFPSRPNQSAGELVHSKHFVTSQGAAKLKESETKERKFEEIVKSAEQAAVLVLVY